MSANADSDVPQSAQSKAEFKTALNHVYKWYAGGFLAFVLTLAVLEQMGLSREWIGLIFLLATILGNCALRLLHHEAPPIPEEMRSLIDLSAAELGMTTEQYLATVYRVGLWLVAFLSLLYQGGMVIYYLRRRAAVARALAETVEPG